MIQKQSGEKQKPIIGGAKIWKTAKQKKGYYLGLTSTDPGNEGREVNRLMSELLEFSDSSLGVTYKIEPNQLQPLSDTDSHTMLSKLTLDPSSLWYRDMLLLIGESIDDNKIYVEPNSDGLEISIYFFGPSAESNYDLTKKWFVSRIGHEG